jgi:uncharacterized repeat protein (TIGR01451 family)
MLILATVTATVTSAQSADLAITSVVGAPNLVGAGGLVSYSVTVINNGPDIATDVQVVDITPADTLFNGATCAMGWAALAFGQHGAVLCTIPSLPPGTTVTHLFQMRVSADVPIGTVIPNMVFITSSTVDASTTNNVGTTGTLVSPGGMPAAVADLAVTKTGPAGPIPAGQNVGYTITVTNNGSAAAPTASFNDLTPPDTTFVSVLQTAGPTFNCTTPGMGAIGVVHCEIGSLAAAASATFTLTLSDRRGHPGDDPDSQCGPGRERRHRHNANQQLCARGYPRRIATLQHSHTDRHRHRHKHRYCHHHSYRHGHCDRHADDHGDAHGDAKPNPGRLQRRWLRRHPGLRRVAAELRADQLR